LRTVQPDILLMDVTMPGMDGLEATRPLKRDPDTREIPTGILTAHALPDDPAPAAEAGADADLSKPCEPRRVVQEIERLLA